MRVAAAVAVCLAVALAGCSGGDDVAAPGGARLPGAADAAGAPVPAGESPAAMPQGTLEAVGVELGTAIDADGRVLRPEARVRPGDTAHVSLVTVGDASAAMLGAEWRDAQGSVLHRDERAISAAGPAVHTFSLKPESGWAEGQHEVTLSLDGEVAGTREFEVR